MSVILSMLRCPDAVPPETREVKGGEFSIGRGPDNDWVLADPDRHLSKRHCMLAFRAGGWQLADLSTNGTFINRETEPLGAGRPRALRDGDRLHLGAYEIEVRLAETLAPRGGRAAGAAEPVGDDPFGAPAAPFSPAPFADEPPLGRAGAPEPMNLPADFDPLGPEPGEEALRGPTQSDHTPAMEDAFRLPAAAPSLLPDDWDLDLTPSAPAAPPSRPAPSPRAPIPPAPQPAMPFDLPEEAPAPPPRAAPPAAAPRPAEPAPPAPRPAAPEPPAPAPVTPAAEPALLTAETDLLASFLRGAGMPDAKLADPAAMFEELGRGFRVLVAGLRAALIARSAIKGEFRIEQTMIRSSGNNPLKFSAGDDDALAALLGAGRRVDVKPSAAIADALRDLRLHELATMAAMQTAVRALLAELDPAPLRHDADQGGMALVPAQRKARAWDAFEKLHARISRALADDFDSVFGKAFARAYEQALTEASGKEGPPA